MEYLKKLLNASQIRTTDEYTIENKSISSLELLERAASAFVVALLKHNLESKKIIVVCGVGNNGGDGFAVCRLLRRNGFNANAMLIKFKENLSKNCLVNKNRLDHVEEISSQSELPDFTQYDVIIDAILGSGLNSPIKGFVGNAIESINNANKKVYSIDIPSGLYSDEISNSEQIIKSAHVISFQRPKLSFFFPENSRFINSWEVVDIGLCEAFIQGQKSDYYMLDEQVSKFVQTRHRQSHKGTFGHTLLLAGSYGKIGSAVLAARSCLRSGAGLLTVAVPKCGYEIMQISVPESMCLIDESEKFLTTLPRLEAYDSIGIGPGIAQNNLTAEMLRELLESCTKPLVLDADAINIIASDKELFRSLPKNTIFTPHIKEFERLVGPSKNTIERLAKQKEFSSKHSCIVVLKDAHTCISSPEGSQYLNTSGNQGMATAGSGDVLTGIIAGLLAQNYEPLKAAIVGVYFHGKAGDQGLLQKGSCALIASDIIDNLKIE